jgi:hypothetical protein
LNDQRKSYYVVRSEYQPERKRKMGRLFIYPSIKKNGNVRDKSGPQVLVWEPYYRTDIGEMSWKGREPIQCIRVTTHSPLGLEGPSLCGDDENRLTPPDLEHQGLRHTQPDNNTVSNVGLLCVANVPRVPLIEVSRFTV